MEKKLVKAKGMNGLIADYLDYTLCANRQISLVDASFQFIADHFSCDRIYIFEFDKIGTMSNTYEWCAEGILPQKDMLQAEPVDTIDPWIKIFNHGNSVVIYDLEEIRELHPRVYAGLKPQNIHSLICTAFWENDEITGFIGVDNPTPGQIDEIIDFFSCTTPYIIGFINRNNHVKRLGYLCFHDQLTGALSVQALEKLESQTKADNSLGMVHFDLSGIRSIHEFRGRGEADLSVIKAYKLLRDVFPFDYIYRLCDVKFVAACRNYTREAFLDKVQLAQTLIGKHDMNMIIGSFWREEKPFRIADMLLFAEKDMFQNRIKKRSKLPQTHEAEHEDNSNEDFLKFIKNNYFNSEVLVNSVAAFDTNYLYFGDLQTNIFYVSDNMRDNFGFESNLVPNLLVEWEKSISYQEDLLLYRNDINEIINQKKDIHDLRYRVRDVKGNDTWIHCRGFVHWNEDRSVPLFFSGSFTSQERDFIVDPITNFPRVNAATARLELHDAEGIPSTIIGFGLNSFSDINELKGRIIGDQLLADIALSLQNNFEGILQFYRLDGLRFAAIMSPNCDEDTEQIVGEIRQVVESQYRSHLINIKNPCAICVLTTKAGNFVPYEALSDIISLISIAKNSPELDYVVHSEESLERQHKQAEMAMELSNNVEDDFENFRIVIQPTVSASDSTITGGEVLLRWKFADKDISPEIFIRMLEKNRQIHAVGRWVFEQTVRAATRSLAMNPHLYLSFNVSYPQILDPSFVPHIEHVIRKYRIDPGCLLLELTETHFDDSPQKLQAFFKKCKQMGIRIALDDFGKGYSSLSLLLKYPTQVVKLDRSILNEMSNSEDNQKFIASVVYACHAFGKKVCAEGVETQGELDIMRNAECDLIQGYYYSKPLELDDFYRLIAERKAF